MEITLFFVNNTKNEVRKISKLEIDIFTIST